MAIDIKTFFMVLSAIITIVAVIAGTFISYGRLSERVNSLQDYKTHNQRIIVDHILNHPPPMEH